MSILNSEYQRQIGLTEEEINKKSSKINQKNITIIKVTKNDSIKSRVTQVLKNLNEDQIILLSAYSTHIPKLVTVIEIAKQNDKDSKSQYFQLNKLIKIESLQNPRMKSFNEDRKNESSNELDPQKQLEKEVLDDIKGPKTYSIPVMFILLSKQNLYLLDLLDWTRQ